MERNSVFTGLVIGAIVPVIGYVIVEAIFELLTAINILDYVATDGMSRSKKTIALLAICFNLIPINVAKAKKWDDTMRGIVFPTLLYVGFWVYQFAAVLF